MDYVILEIVLDRNLYLLDFYPFKALILIIVSQLR